MDHREALAFLDTLASEAKPAKSTLRLERIRLLLELWGSPQDSFESVHVVGTAGKGSTATLCAAILHAHGHSVGLHLSPHIQVINERMQVDGRLIGANEFASLVEQVIPLCEQVGEQLSLGRPTYYETTLAMAFTHFAEKKVEYAVVEAGLGARMDATNVLEPAAVIFTNVFLDHKHLLGTTIEEIAQDKVGAIKTGVPVVTGATGNALAIVQSTCAEKKSPLSILGIDCEASSIHCTTEGTSFDLRVGADSFPSLRSPLLGSHQAANSALAATGAKLALGRLDESPLRTAIESTAIPCRFEIVSRNPLVILDGAHNPAKAQVLAQTLSLFPQKKHGVIAIAENKDAAGLLSALVPCFETLTFTHIDAERDYWNPAELQKLAGMGMVEPDPKKAIAAALASAPPDSAVVITGTFRLPGIAREKYLSNGEALAHCSLAIPHERLGGERAKALI